MTAGATHSCAKLLRDGISKSDWREKAGKSGKASKGREHKSFREHTHYMQADTFLQN